jgi:hypothetical protein
MSGVPEKRFPYGPRIRAWEVKCQIKIGNAVVLTEHAGSRERRPPRRTPGGVPRPQLTTALSRSKFGSIDCVTLQHYDRGPLS